MNEERKQKLIFLSMAIVMIVIAMPAINYITIPAMRWCVIKRQKILNEGVAQSKSDELLGKGWEKWDEQPITNQTPREMEHAVTNNIAFDVGTFSFETNAPACRFWRLGGGEPVGIALYPSGKPVVIFRALYGIAARAEPYWKDQLGVEEARIYKTPAGRYVAYSSYEKWNYNAAASPTNTVVGDFETAAEVINFFKPLGKEGPVTPSAHIAISRLAQEDTVFANLWKREVK